MTSDKKLTPARRLKLAMERCAMARGEVQWTNGYRTGRGREADATEDARLWEKEQAQWREVGRADSAFLRLAQRLTRGAR